MGDRRDSRKEAEDRARDFSLPFTQSLWYLARSGSGDSARIPKESDTPVTKA